MKLENIKSKNDWNIKKGHTEQTNTHSKSTVEALEKGGKYD